MLDISPGVGIVLGSVLGAWYFHIAEKGIPKTSNCQYLAPWTTDLFAWLGGAWLINRGLHHKDGIICMMGMTAATLHVAQFAAHKVITNRMIGS